MFSADHGHGEEHDVSLEGGCCVPAQRAAGSKQQRMMQGRMNHQLE